MNKLIKNKKAFTIIELIVIMAVLAIFVTMGVPRMSGFTKEANMTKLLNDAKVIEDASHRYYLQHGEWPRAESEMTAEEIATFTDKIYSSAGKVITLEPEGKYYGVDMMKLAGFVSVKSDKNNFILQNPVGNVYALNPENNRALEEGFIVKEKPIAVISMIPETNISTTTTIAWNHNSSTSQEGYNIVDVEWEGEQSKYTEGTYTVRLRVKSSNGLWSNWTEKNFEVVNLDTNPKTAAEVTAMGFPFTIQADGTYAVGSMTSSLRYTGTASIINIPSSIDGIPVTAIGGSLFYNKGGITAVSMPDTITKIGNAAFYGFSGNITHWSTNLKSIGSSAFHSCYKLEPTIALPKGLQSIGVAAFGNSPVLRKIWIPDSSKMEGKLNVSSSNESQFYVADPSIKIYCESPSQPSNWWTGWRPRTYNGYLIGTVTWGVSLEEFNALP